jgi:ABC-type transport system involved in multi-copper enzyme maturation permease subunit
MIGFFGIIEKELLSILRNRRTVVTFIAVALSFSLLVLLKWPSGAIVDLSGTQARQVFRWLTSGMLATVLLIVPAYPATSLVREIRGRTLELLLNTPLSRSTILIGKMCALLGLVALLLFSTFPAMACCYLMGGLSLSLDIARLYTFLLTVSLQVVVLSLLVGTFARTVESALRWSYGATFIVCVLTIVPHLFLQGGAGVLADMAGWLNLMSPITVLQDLINKSSVGNVGLMDQRDPWIWYQIFAGLMIVAGTVLCVVRLNRGLLDKSRDQGRITDDQTLKVRAARRVLFLIDPQRRSPGIPLFLNPVLVKEFRSRQFGRLHWLLRLIAGAAVLSLLLTLATTTGTIDWGVENTGAVIIVLQVALILLLTPGMSGAMVAGEIESGGWNLLRVTPLSPLRIMLGKLVSVGITLALLLCATLPGYSIIMLIKPALREQVLQVLNCLVLAATVSLLTGATVSSFCRRSATATTVTYGLLIALFAGTMIVWMNEGAPFGPSLVEAVLTLNPMAAAMNAIRARGFEQYVLIPRAWWVSGGLCLGLLLVLYLRIRRLCQPD